MKSRPQHYYKQSGVIPIKVKGGKILALLVTTRKKKKWIIPKGIVQPGLSPQVSAAKEALEEAGVIGSVVEKRIGKYSYKKWGGKCSVSVFLMHVTAEFENWEEDFRERVWTPLTKIPKLIDNPELLHLFEKLENFASLH